MRRSRLLILVALVLLLGAGGVLMLGNVLRVGPFAPPASAATPAASPTPAETLKIVVAAQDIPRGALIPADQLQSVEWPKTSLLPSMITDTAQVAGMIARYDITRYQPILTSDIVKNLRDVGVVGSDAALQIPQGMVAMAVPFTRLSGVAYAIADGDHVDVFASFLFVDLDKDFQTLTPNAVWGITYQPPNSGVAAGPQLVPVAVPGAPFSYGKPAPDVFTQFFANYPGISPLPFYVAPSEVQRPRLVTQRIVQDATVLHVGTFVPPQPTAVPTPTLAPNQPSPTPPPGQQAAAAEKPKPDIITLVVAPQDAAVLTYVMSADIKVNFALRSAGDTSRVDTESVTLQSLVDRFKIAIPAKLEYGLEPPVRVIQPPSLPNDPTRVP
ncbi:MAG: Flp pilus assembly protein CpaB [Chloroflexi bacterium]|nr:Flp pilus assembly protein CpaB [Chloroflexota bacterium]